jgi:hypothetical protein
MITPIDLRIKILRHVIRAVPSVLPYLAPDTIKAAGYDSIRTVMSGAIFGAVFGFLNDPIYIAKYRDQMATAVTKAYLETADVAYVDGGSELPLDDETAAWARAQLDAQLAYVDALFDDLKELRKNGDFDAGEVATARAEGYAGSLDAFYGEAKMRGSENKTLEFGGTDGKESCPDCQKLVRKRHKIKYILDNNLIPKPGNDRFQCKGYECNHFWFDPKTGERFDG